MIAAPLVTAAPGTDRKTLLKLLWTARDMIAGDLPLIRLHLRGPREIVALFLRHPDSHESKIALATIAKRFPESTFSPVYFFHGRILTCDFHEDASHFLNDGKSAALSQLNDTIKRVHATPDPPPKKPRRKISPPKWTPIPYEKRGLRRKRKKAPD